MVLLRCLVAAGFGGLVVCHLNHGLRGPEADEDAAFVRRLAESLELPFEGGAAEVAALAELNGQSLETAGRFARHVFFAAVAKRYDCRRLMLAHHADDQAETVLMNLCRGSAGLSGMSEENWLKFDGVETLLLIRPLLSVRKSTLILEAERRGWAYREDASNHSADFVRNRLRHEALPLLADIFQRDPAPALVRAEQWSAEAKGFLRENADPWVKLEKLPVKEIAALAQALRREVLAGWLRARGVPDLSASLVETAERILVSGQGQGPAKWNLPGNRFLRRRAGWLWIESVPACGGDAD